MSSFPWLIFDSGPTTSTSLAVDQARVGLRAMGPGTASLAKKATTLRFTTLYHITAYGGNRELWLTTHTEPILFEGDTYSPAALQESARRGQTGGVVPNSDIVAVIDDAFITEDDLFRRVYSDCVIVTRVVDYRYPWAGSFEHNTRYIESITHDGEVFTASAQGKTSKLKDKAGYTFTRPCPAALGDVDCSFDLSVRAGDTVVGATVAVVASDRDFTMNTMPTAVADGFYTWGRIVWTSGLNTGHVSVVRSYVDSSKSFELIDNAPFAPLAGDVGTVYAGCDGLRATCKTKFDNFDNYQGHPFLIGSDRQFNTPS